MVDLEIPSGKRTLKYRLFEMLPAVISYGALILLVVLSLLNPTWAAVYLLLVITTLLVKAVGIAFRTIQGRRHLEAAQKVDWHSRLADLEDPQASYEVMKHSKSRMFKIKEHVENLRMLSMDPGSYPKPSQLYNAVIIATYNESHEILAPTIQNIIDSTYDTKRIILVLGYEHRGGEKTKANAYRLQKEFKDKFFDFLLVEHPDSLPGEVIGKGPNITYAGFYLKKWLKKEKIESKNVMVTTLDSDNRPYPSYFDYVMYEYIVHEDRKHLSYQPTCLYFNNIWDAPAPMRVIATGNSFWTIISSMRPHTLRNFASHSQSMDALEEMNFWSTRSIVEDGHQYWRSYFHFDGDYAVLPIYVPIYQDAVLSKTLLRTLKGQFLQLQRWAYGASDVAYVAVRVFSRNRKVPLLGGIARLLRLLDGHVTLACVSILVAFGGWVPLLINSQADRSIAAHQLPDIVSTIQQVALIGLFITIFITFKMLPPRPERYKRTRSFWMLAQWVLMPFTAVLYNSMAAYNSQTHLLIGKYLEVFNVTDKETHETVAKTKKSHKLPLKLRER